MENITTIQVGKKYDLFKRNTGFSDGAYFEALEDNEGFFMSIYLGGMDATERHALESEIIRVRMIKEGNKILFITRYGKTPLMFEVNFDPTLYEDERVMQIVFDNHMVTFVGIERSNNIVQTLRQANFPMKLKQTLITAWMGAFEEEDYSTKYTNWTLNLYNKFTTFELWDIGEDVGYFGEKGVFE
jgi:hypothetical protein